MSISGKSSCLRKLVTLIKLILEIVKKYVFIFSLVILLFSCSSPENKAKKAIKEELRLTLHDFKSYKPVQFGKLKVARSSYEDLQEVKKYHDKVVAFLALCKEYKEKSDLYTSDYWEYTTIADNSLDSAKFYMDKVETIKIHFISEVIGWKMTHSFRAKNLDGNLGIHHYLFVLDKELSKVIQSVALSEEK